VRCAVILARALSLSDRGESDLLQASSVSSHARCRPFYCTVHFTSNQWCHTHGGGRHSTLGDCAFPVASARAWNSLLLSVRNALSLTTFHLELKTALFRSSFDDD